MRPPAVARMPTPFQAARATDIDEGFNSPWLIEKRVPEEHFTGTLGGVFRTGRGMLEPGAKITMLRRHGTLVMSDTPDEIRDLAPIFARATGRVLVHGLGLGCVVRGLLSMERVDHVDVVEISPALIELMGGYFEDERVTIHEGDAINFDWPKGTRWNCVWHDVWDTLCADNLTEAGGYAEPCSYEKLHRKFGRKCDWQGSWGWEFLKRHG